MEKYIRWMQEIGLEDLETVGEEVLLLSELLREEYPVLPGFVVLPAAYAAFLEENGLSGKGRAERDGWNDLSFEARAGRLEAFRKAVLEAEMDPSLETEIRNAARRMQAEEDAAPMPLSVRPLILPEPSGLPALFDGWDLLHNLRDETRLASSVRRGWSCAWADEVFEQCTASGIDPFSVRVVLLIQRFVSPRVAGVFSPADAADPMKPERVIDACWGMGEAVVSGRFEADQFVLQYEPLILLEQSVGDKEKKMVPRSNGSPGIQEVEVPEDLAEMPCLSWDQIQDIAETGRAAEKHAGRSSEMHWAFEDGELLILRAVSLSEAEYREDALAGIEDDEPHTLETEALERKATAAEAAGKEAAEKDAPGLQDVREPDEREVLSGTGEEPENASAEEEAASWQGPDDRGDGPQDVAAGEAGAGAPSGEKTVGSAEAAGGRVPWRRSPAERVSGSKLGWKDRARAQVLSSLFRSAKRLRRKG